MDIIFLEFESIPSKLRAAKIARYWKDHQQGRQLFLFTDGLQSYAVLIPGLVETNSSKARILGLQTSHAYHFKIVLQRLWNLKIAIVEDYLKKWVTWASRSRMPDIIKLGKTINRHLAGITETIGSGINSAVLKVSRSVNTEIQ